MDNSNDNYQVVHGWPQLPENDSLGQVTGVSVDSHNRVFISHRGANKVRAFDGETGEQVVSWDDTLFNNLHDIEVDSEDNLWVTDAGNHQVYKFSNDGELLMTIGEKEVNGNDHDHLGGPTGVTVLPSGDFYISDGYGNNRVVKFNKEGQYLTEWGQLGETPGDFNLPHGIASDNKNRVYVADRSNSRIQVFDSEGEFLYEWISKENGRPWGMSVGDDGYLYVIYGGELKEAPPERNVAVKMDLNGAVLETWGRFGKYNGQLYWGHDIAVGKDGAVYVSDVNLGMRVQKFVNNH